MREGSFWAYEVKYLDKYMYEEPGDSGRTIDTLTLIKESGGMKLAGQLGRGYTSIWSDALTGGLISTDKKGLWVKNNGNVLFHIKRLSTKEGSSWEWKGESETEEWKGNGKVRGIERADFPYLGTREALVLEIHCDGHDEDFGLDDDLTIWLVESIGIVKISGESEWGNPETGDCGVTFWEANLLEFGIVG